MANRAGARVSLTFHLAHLYGDLILTCSTSSPLLSGSACVWIPPLSFSLNLRPQGEIHTFDPVSKVHHKEAYGKPVGNIQLRNSKPGVRLPPPPFLLPALVPFSTQGIAFAVLLAQLQRPSAAFNQLTAACHSASPPPRPPCPRSQLLVAASRELYKTNPSKPGLLFPVAEPVPRESRCRQFNDGYCDRVGRWLTGTKSDEKPGSEGTGGASAYSPPLHLFCLSSAY